jgi:hypothetical protein
MEVIVNGVVLSTDRACGGIRNAKKPIYPAAGTAIEINLPVRCPIFRSLKNPLL